jgi:hypothetical protein
MTPKHQPVRSQQLRRSARGRSCTARIPQVCNHDPDTSVLAHPPIGNGGMGTKGDDSDGAIVCSECHDAIDGRSHYGVPREELLECWIRARQETDRIWREMELIEIKGAA